MLHEAIHGPGNTSTNLEDNEDRPNNTKRPNNEILHNAFIPAAENYEMQNIPGTNLNVTNQMPTNVSAASMTTDFTVVNVPIANVTGPVNAVEEPAAEAFANTTEVNTSAVNKSAANVPVPLPAGHGTMMRAAIFICVIFSYSWGYDVRRQYA